MKKRLGLVLVLVTVCSAMLLAGGTAEETDTGEDTVKAAFIYIGPAGDFGWTYAHDQGRLYAESQLPWLETVTVESVPEGDAVRFIDRLVQEQNVDVVFTTSFGYMEDTVAAAEKYPNVDFFHASGFMRAENLGTYMGDMYQIYYLNGLIAGAITKTDKIGYVAAFPIPELFRHMNAFAIGAKEVNPDTELSARWIYAWYGPDLAREAAEALVADGNDVLGFTEDTPTVVEVAQEKMDAGQRVFALSHYSPMAQWGPEAAITGQLTDWGGLYVRMLEDYRSGETEDMTDYDLLWLMKDDAVELGATWEERINPEWVDELQAMTMDHPEFGEISIYDLVMTRYDQMKQGRDVFDPFTGPIVDQSGEVRIPAGEVASIPHLFAEMNYHTDNWVTAPPQE